MKKPKPKVNFILNTRSGVVHRSDPGERCNTDDMRKDHRKRVAVIDRAYTKCKRCFGKGN
jgi:hypothetical protein